MVTAHTQDGSVPGRVLVLDRYTDAASTLALLLELNGFAVRTAPDGRAGIAIAAEFHPHVVVTELDLEGAGGAEVAEALAALPAADRPRVVVLTAWADNRSRARLDAAGVGALHLKPGDPDLLVRLLQRLCPPVPHLVCL